MATIRVTGLDSLNKKLNQTADKASNLQPAFKTMAPKIIVEFKENFDTKGKTLSSPWAKRKYNYPHPLLQKSGKLKKTWKKKTNKKSLEIKNPIPYAIYHHLGMRPQTGKRKLVGFSKPIRQIVRDTIIKYILKPFFK